MAIRIVFFGDSICVGQNVSIDKIWVNQMSVAIGSALSGYAASVEQELIVANPSINGNTTRMALERMPFDVQQSGATFVYTQFGLNDCNYWATDNKLPRVSLAAYEANLREIVARARASGAGKVAIGTNHATIRSTPAFEGADFTYEDSRRAYNEAVRRVAANDPDLLLMDIAKVLDDHVTIGRCTLPETLHSDGLHLSELGHDLYFAHMKANLLPAIIAAVKA
jgi:acyl-CoA thioesterase I